MKFSTLLTLGAMSVSSVSAADLADVQFLTALVSDFDDNRAQYLLFLRTASDVPAELTSLALKVVTYTDDAYTTLLDNTNLDITQLKSFATELPWYTRITAEENASAAGSESSAASGSSDASSQSSSTGSSESSSSTGSSGAGTSIMALAGALVGAVAVLLL